LRGVVVASLPLPPEAPEAVRGVSVQRRADTVVMGRRSTALMVAGIVMASIGTGAVIGGGIVSQEGRKTTPSATTRPPTSRSP
jgi:hypothetical protein